MVGRSEPSTDSPASARARVNTLPQRVRALPDSVVCSSLKRFERRPENVIGGELRTPCLGEASSSRGNKGAYGLQTGSQANATFTEMSVNQPELWI